MRIFITIVTAILLSSCASTINKEGHSSLLPEAIKKVLSSRDTTWIDSFSVEELNQTNQWNRSALTYAVLFNNKHITKKLLSKGVKINVPDKWGYSPLQYSTVISKSCTNNLFPAELIKAVDTSAISQNYNNQQKLLDSTFNALIHITTEDNVELPLLATIDLNTPFYFNDWTVTTLVGLMAKERYRRPLELLVKNDAYINCQNSNGLSGLYAVDWEDTAMQTIMLDLGAEINAVNTHGKHISIMLTENADTAYIDRLVKQGMTLDPETLKEAIENNKSQMILYLSSRVHLKADQRFFHYSVSEIKDTIVLNNLVSDSIIDSIFVKALIRKNNPEATEWLLRKHVKLDSEELIELCITHLTDSVIIESIVNDVADTSILNEMLYRAMIHDNYLTGRTIINHLGKIPATHRGITFFPAQKCDTSMISYLLKNGGSINDTNHFRYNLPLGGAAAKCGNAQIISWIIKKGADVNGSHSKNGYTAFYQVVRDNYNQEVIDTLLAAGSDPLIPSTAGRTFHYEIVRKDSILIPLIKKLIAFFPDRDPMELNGLKSVDTSGYYFFTHVCLNGNKKLFDSLVTWGKPYNLPSKDMLRQALIYTNNDSIKTQLLAMKAPLNGVDDNGNNLLHKAIHHEKDSLFLLALKEKELINQQNQDGQTPLMVAAVNYGNYGNKRWYMDSLIALGADLNIPDTAGHTPIHFISDIEYFRTLIKQGASVDIRYNDGGSLLHKIIGRYHSDSLALEVINHCKNTDLGLYYGMTPLGYCAAKKNKTLIHALVKKGANIQHPSVLKEAVESGDTSIINLVLRLGAKPAKNWAQGGSLLTRAKSLSVFTTLLDAGASPNSVNSIGQSPLMTVKDTTKARLLVKYGAKLNLLDKNKDNALSYAAYSGDTTMFNWLLKQGAEIQKDILFLAITGRNISIIQKLLNMGFSTDAPLRDGLTPLHYCVIIDHRGTILSTFLKQKIDINKIANSMTPLMIAAVDKNNIAISHLIKHGTKLDISTPKNHRTALHYAAITQCNDYESDKMKSTIIQLLEAGANANPRDINGLTPLIWAVKLGNSERAKTLLKYGADKSITDNYGKKATDYLSNKNDAAKYGLSQ